MSDRFELIERLSAGASSTVYRASDAGGEVALKVLHPHLASDVVVRNRFLREAEILAKVRHPHIVRVHDVQEIEGQPAMVMELLTGGSLRGRILEAAAALSLLGDLADALAEIHRHGIVHRDLRPEHVLFDAEDRPRIIDFGMASVKDLSGLTRSTVFTARPEFVDPFTWGRGRPLPAQDIYSLGAVIHTAVVGKAPPVSVFGRIDAPERERALAEMTDRVGSPLGDIVRAMLESPARRPRSAAEVRDWIQDGISGGRRLSQCLYCSSPMPIEAPICLECGKEPLQVRLDPAGEYIALRKMSEEKDILGPFLSKLRLLADGPVGDIRLILGDARLYSRAEQKAGLRLPVRIADGIHPSSVEPLISVLQGEGSSIRILSYPMSRVAKTKRGPLVKLREGRILPDGIAVALRNLGRRPQAPRNEDGDLGRRSQAPRNEDGDLRSEAKFAVSIATARLAADPATVHLVDEVHITSLWKTLEAAIDGLEKTYRHLREVHLQDLYADMERLEAGSSPRVAKERGRLISLFNDYADTERDAAATEQRVVRACRTLEQITPGNAVEQLRLVEEALG